MANAKWQYLFIIAISVFICLSTTLAMHKLLESWGSYDPKEQATEKVIQCLNATQEEQQQLCGLLTGYPCLKAIPQSINNTNQEYEVEILWYNWDDHIPNRGGDEVYLQVTFSDETIFRILWYEGTLEYCEIEN